MRPTGSAAQRDYRRQRGGNLVAQGKGVREVARLLAVTPASVGRWRQALQQGGPAALRAKPHPGPKPQPAAGQRTQGVAQLRKGPQTAGYPTELWTCPRVAAVIRNTFGVHDHPARGWRLLRAVIWSPQQPERRARERDEKAITRWRTRTWPRLKKSPPAASASCAAR
jgi:transposase